MTSTTHARDGSDSVDTITHNLRAQIDELQKQLADLNDKRQSVTKKLVRCRQALAALDGIAENAQFFDDFVPGEFQGKYPVTAIAEVLERRGPVMRVEELRNALAYGGAPIAQPIKGKPSESLRRIGIVITTNPSLFQWVIKKKTVRLKTGTAE